MKLLYISVFLNISFFAMASTPEAKVENVSVTRALTSDSNADISSSSSFDACNVHFSDYKFPALSEDKYFEKNRHYQSGIVYILVRHLKGDMILSKLALKELMLVALIIKLFMIIKIRHGN